MREERAMEQRHGWMFATMLGVTACLLSTACTTRPGQPADDAAAAIERYGCRSVDDNEISHVLSGAAVERWEPAYYSAAGSGKEDNYKRLAGAAFTLQPRRGDSAEWLNRALACHSAKKALAPDPSDPFSLPGRPVDIDVKATGKDFTVLVRSMDVADATEIVVRARAFAARPDERTPPRRPDWCVSPSEQ
jgi:hypothetical protein